MHVKLTFEITCYTQQDNPGGQLPFFYCIYNKSEIRLCFLIYGSFHIQLPVCTTLVKKFLCTAQNFFIPNSHNGIVPCMPVLPNLLFYSKSPLFRWSNVINRPVSEHSCLKSALNLHDRASEVSHDCHIGASKASAAKGEWIEGRIGFCAAIVVQSHRLAQEPE